MKKNYEQKSGQLYFTLEQLENGFLSEMAILYDLYTSFADDLLICQKALEEISDDLGNPKPCREIAQKALKEVFGDE